jgi:hypothetical protein
MRDTADHRAVYGSRRFRRGFQSRSVVLPGSKPRGRVRTRFGSRHVESCWRNRDVFCRTSQWSEREAAVHTFSAVGSLAAAASRRSLLSFGGSTRAAMTTRLTIITVSLFWATQAFAHRPYEVAAGSFTRSDGVTVSAVKHYVDGILGADPVSVQFRLPDGSVIAQTERTRDSVVVCGTSLGIEVYRFQTDWIPFASSVERFDGFSLADASSRRTSLLSALVHTRAHLREYAVVLALVGVFVGCWFAARAIPKRGWLAVIRVFGFVTVALSFSLFVLLVLFAVPVSPFIACAFGGIVVAACFAMRRFVSHAKAEPNAGGNSAQPLQS